MHIGAFATINFVTYTEIKVTRCVGHERRSPPREVPSPSLHYDDAPRSFRTGRLERELQMVQLSASRCCRIAIL
jgi:hypothetical protein